MSRAPAKRTLKRRPQPARGRAPAKKIGLMDRAVAVLPVSETTLRKAAGWGMFGAACAVLIVMASYLGIPGMAGTALAEGVGRAGFRVEQIEVTGANRMDRMTVYAVALDQRSRAMPLIDLATVRDRLLDYPWIADARVSRRLPDTLAIDIVERVPVAIWQNHGQLMLIDVTGKPLEPVSPEAMPPLPLVIGDGANEREPDYQRLMQVAPALKSQVKAATWIGDRRWDILFASGEKLSLPEGERLAAQALTKFAELDRRDRLLGRGYVSFDLRDPAKLVLRLPGGATNNRAITGE
ncbi:cell division protein FtsQ/DivIB [Sphingomonas sp.]|uniref:cell division protein FtsQ/DivIB n=1 Tax=Sphingomonas sp. TaxID=28214 RepID=UPI002DD632AE|nr:FtsQ-type POTRA domain-containing protein [Sphingomonas sp.]